ncbi:MAG: 4Fe-4S dicluster domain-containing protein [Candidatus Hadarchaeota archaeon]
MKYVPHPDAEARRWQAHAIPKESLDIIFNNLKSSGYSLIGPTVRDGQMLLAEIDSTKDLPIGYIDVQGPGWYKLKKEGAAYFAYVNGQNSIKRFLFLPEVDLIKVKKEGNRLACQTLETEPKKQAIVGIRACDLTALGVLDKTFAAGEFPDSSYLALRKEIFILAVTCTRAGEHCFCASMGAGPHIKNGYDLALTELDDCFLVRVGSDKGADAMKGVEVRPATLDEINRANRLVDETAEKMVKHIDTTTLRENLYKRLASPLWSKAAETCLSCGNCTMVCPTCFCNDVLDAIDLSENAVVRRRLWDSCFSMDHGEIATGNARPTITDRYRQWMMHKLVYWVDQYGVYGCVGCGRCITWCPVGIDITENEKLLRRT